MSEPVPAAPRDAPSDPAPYRPPGPPAATPTAPPVAARAPRLVVRPWLGRALFEAALIGLSVALGFAVTEWRDRQAARQRARQALDAIAIELDSNRVLVQRARSLQGGKADTLERLAATGDSIPLRVYVRGMFDPARVQSTAWEAARAGDALRELPYALVLQLGRVYERQAQYRDLSDRLIADLYTDVRRDGIETHMARHPMQWAMLNRDFAGRAEVLADAYAHAAAAVRATRGAR